ncbi:peptidoglycan DD-metalloendopeptidase family protein [Paenarthrobacter nitroguajacolicus]|uniref:peptidoglycan DD-metalloendopeptidase family protein n=1 Tax=Paenarthrobacter nitroguajacolicus TaxID=211146 RepID=UPI00248C9F0B|nr:peptidoglycan DD-metalloendopeptidase family protein [Paenarthrobacter nitroguajacolicus]MDI2033000.1 hypothetical protein [Paenarthrobacter nitroguajacolicus]
MASELAAMYVSIAPNMSGFLTGVQKELKGVDGYASATGTSSGSAFSSAFGRAVSGAGEALATVLKVGAGAALAGIGAAGAVGVKTAAQLETAQISFTTMLGSGEKAQAFLQDLSNFAAATPFELPGLETSASALVSAGIDATKVIPIMTSLGNATSGMGTGAEGIQRATVALQQMNAAQKISAEDLNQLRDAGIPVYDLLAAATGKSAVEIADMAANGKLGRQELEQLMTALETGKGLERFNGLMEQQSKSLSGLWSTAKDTFSTGLADVVQPAIPLIKDGLGGATGFLADVVLPKAKVALADTVGGISAFQSAWTVNDGISTTSGFPGLMEKTAFFLHCVSDGLGKLNFSSLDGFLSSVKSTGGEVGPVLADVGSSLAGLWPAVKEFSAQAPTLATGGLKLLAGALGFLSDHVQTIIDWMPAIVAGFVAWRVAQIALNAAAAVTPGIQLAVNLTRIAAARAEMGLTAAHKASAAAAALSSEATAVQSAVTQNATRQTIAQRVATVAASVAQKASAAAQWLWNAAMSANPIGIVIAAVAALVAGLVWFFTQTELGKEIWANVWGFIQTLVAGFMDWWNGSFVPAFSTGVQAVGAFFTWLWETSVKPTIDAVGAVIMWLWDNVIVPAFNAWMTIIGGFMAFFQALGEIVVAVIQQWIAPMFVWLWEQVIVPAWNGIMSVIGAAWTWINDNVFAPIGVGISVMGQLWDWYWNQVIVPVWNGIMSALGAAWAWIDANVFQPIRVGVDLLGQGFNYLWSNVVVPVWQGIQDAIGGTWNWIRDTVFTPLTDFIQKTIPAAFEAGKDAIGRAWELIRDVVKAPIAFVIDTVINNGIIGAINTVRGWFQLEKLPTVAMPAGFATGGYTGPGGVNDPAGIVHAGEIVWSQADISRWGGVGVVEALRNAKGYASGGLVSPLDSYVLSQGFSGLSGHNGLDMAAPTGTPIHAAGPGTVSFAAWSVYGGGNEIHIDHPNGLQTWYAHMNGFNIGQGAQVSQGQTLGPVGMTGLATGPHLHYMVLDGGWPNVLDPTPYLTGGGSAGSGAGAAMINPLAGLLDGFLSSLSSAFPDAGPMLEVAVGAVKMVFDDAMKGLGDLISGAGDRSGAVKGSTRGPSVSPVLFDNGGFLEQTTEPFLIQHKRTRPDAVLTDSQWKMMSATSDSVRDLSSASIGDAVGAALENARIELGGVNYLANAVSARIVLAKQRRV